MAQLIVRVDGTFSGPQVVADPRLNAGSILLIEPGYPGREMTSVADGVLVPNIAAAESEALYPAADASILTVSNTLTATTGIAEITPRGGLHVAVKQAGTVTLERLLLAMNGSLVTALDTVMAAGATRLYISLWGRVTRQSIYTVASYSFVGLMVSNSSATYFGPTQSGTTGNISTTPTTSTEGRTTATLSGGVGPFRVDIGHMYTGGDPSLSSSFVRLGNAVGGHQDKAPSWILYAAYLENLDASGRTYAEASALDQQMYDAAFGVGGRYYDDSWTDPLTL
jgi:hypothetical protein